MSVDSMKMKIVHSRKSFLPYNSIIKLYIGLLGDDKWVITLR